MAGETTTTSTTSMVNTEALTVMAQDYAKDEIVIAPWARVGDLTGRGSLTLSWPRWLKDAGSDIAQATAMTNQTIDLSDVTTVAAGVGVLREILRITELAVIPGVDLYQFAVEDGTYLCTEMLEDDLAATFASAGNSVGSSGFDMTISNFVEAIAKMRAANARGQYVCVLDDQQASDFTQNVATTGAAVLGGGNIDQTVLNARNDGYVGTYMQVPIAMTNLTDTANGGADVVGCMFVNGNASMGGGPNAVRYGGLGIALLSMPYVAANVDVAHPSKETSVSMIYGAAMIYTTMCTKIVTDA